MFYAQFRHICTLHGPVYEVRPMQRKIDLKNVVFSKKYDPDFLCLWFLCFANIIFVYDKRYFLKIYDFWPCILQYLQQIVLTNYVTKANSRLFFQSCLQYVTQIFVQCWLINIISKIYILTSILFLFSGRGGSAGAKFRIALGLPVGAVINCADNTGKKKVLKKYIMKQ